MEEETWEHKDTMHATYPFLFEDEGTLFSNLEIKWLLYMHVIVCICVQISGTTFFLGGENVKPEKNSIFLNKAKTVICCYSTG